MTRTIATCLPKGGTGKTSTTLNLGAALAERGQRVLLIDFDPQANLSQALGVNPDQQERNIYWALKRLLSSYEARLTDAIIPTAAGVDLVPGTALLNLANEELALALEREKALRKLSASVTGYDFIFIDTLPYLGILTVNALVAAHEVLIPLQAEYLATQSTKLILDHVEIIRRAGLNQDLRVAGILFTMVDQRLLINREVVDYATRTLGTRVPLFNAQIKRSVRVPESQARHQSILQYDPTGPVAAGYRALAEEVLHVEA